MVVGLIYVPSAKSVMCHFAHHLDLCTTRGEGVACSVYVQYHSYKLYMVKSLLFIQ